MASLGKLVVDLAADTGRFEQSMTRSSHLMGRQMGRMKTHVNSFSKTFGRLNLAAQAGLAVLNTAVLARFANDADRAAKMATRLGESVEQYTAFRAPLDKAGIELDTFGTIMQRITRRSAEAAKGGGEAVNAFREMGIDAQKFAQLDLEEKVLALAEAYQQFDPDNFLSLIQKIGDTEATELGQLFAQGPKGLREALKQARDYNDFISEDLAKSVEDLNDNMADLESRWQGLMNRMSERASGRLNDTFRFFENIDKRFPGATEFINRVREFEAGGRQGILSALGFDQQAAAAGKERRMLQDRMSGMDELKRAHGDLAQEAEQTASSLAKVFDPEIQNEFKLEEKIKQQAENLKQLTSFARTFVLPDLQDQATASEFSGVGREIDRARTYLGPSAVTGNQQSAAQRQLERATDLLERIEYNTKRNELAEAGVLL